MSSLTSYSYYYNTATTATTATTTINTLSTHQYQPPLPPSPPQEKQLEYNYSYCYQQPTQPQSQPYPYYYYNMDTVDTNDYHYDMVYTPPLQNSTNYEAPLLQFDDINVLQDDNFSIVTATDLYSNTSPLLSTSTTTAHTDTNTAQLTPYSAPSSPQFNAAASYYDGSFNHHYTQSDLFVPVPQHQPKKSKKVSSTTNTSITEKRHICPICSHRSKRRHNLVEHMLTHNPHRPKTFLCGHCSRPFARKYDMKRHEKIHSR